MAAATKEGTPPPIIGKAGRYTVFITPPATPKTPSPSPRPLPLASGLSPSPGSSPENTAAPAPAPVAVKASSPPPPPVQVPPPQFDGKPCSSPSNSALGFFWEAMAKVQDAHSRLDEYLAYWLGLNQSKYQWALNDLYESKTMDLETGKSKDVVGKGQSV